MTIGQKIKEIRESQNIRLTDAANSAGLSRQRLWQIEQDISDDPRIQTLAQVSKGINCSVIDIVRGTIYDSGESLNDSALPCANAEKCPFYKKE